MVTHWLNPSPAGEGDYVVRPGDSVVGIAAAHGVLPDTLWNDPANAALKECRADPELLLPGDRLAIVPVRVVSRSCVTGRRHVFRRKGVPVTVTIVAEDQEGTPFAGKRYVLLAGDVSHEGVTTDAGEIECSVDPACTTGRLQIWLDEPGLPDPWEHDVAFGTLHPPAHLAGIQQRLRNLGLYRGADDGLPSEDLQAAVRNFQRLNGLDVTGELDAGTVGKLTEIHRI